MQKIISFNISACNGLKRLIKLILWLTLMMEAMEYPNELGAIFPVNTPAPVLPGHLTTQYWMWYWLFSLPCGRMESQPPTPGVQPPYPHPFFSFLPPSHFFLTFFGGYSRPIFRIFAPAPRPSDPHPCPFFIKSPPTPTPRTPKPPSPLSSPTLPCLTLAGSRLPWSLTQYGLVTPYGDINLVQHWFRSWLVPDFTKPLPEPMVTYQSSMPGSLGTFQRKHSRYQFIKWVREIHLKVTFTSLWGHYF